MGKDAWIFLHNQVDVAQSHILDFALSRQQSHQGRRHLLVQCLHCGLILNEIQLLQNDLNKDKHAFKTLAMQVLVVCEMQ